jgi:hypothetical protein
VKETHIVARPAPKNVGDAPTETPGTLTEAALQIFTGDITAVDGIYSDPNGAPLGLFARIARLMLDLPDVDPAGKNDHFKYKFLTNTQINGLLRPRLARQRIVVVPLKVVEMDPVQWETSKGGRSMLTRLHVTFQIVDALNGETFTGEVVGYGDDSSDKGANKAFTAALKNFLVKLFLIGGDSDIEDDEETDRRAAARDAGAPHVGRADIGDAEVTGVKRGGRSESATDAQVATVGRFVRDLQLTPGGFATIVDAAIGDRVELGDKPWDDIKAYLEQLSGQDIGKLVARLDAITRDTDAKGNDEGGHGGY